MRLKIVLQLVCIIGLTGCSEFKSAVAAGASSLGFGDKPHPPVAFMSSEQMLKTMISSTGTEGLGEVTDAADDLIQSTYNERTGSLPSTQSLYQANGPTMIAATNLASSICAKAVDRDRAVATAQADERLFFREIDFGQGPSAVSSAAAQAGFARLTRNAWRRAPTSAETETINTFVKEFTQGINGADPNQTRLLAVGLCTAALSSLDALTY